MESVRLQLEMSYKPGIVGIGIERARGTAQKRGEPLDSDMRDRAFYNILQHELTLTESWIIRQLRALEDHDDEYATEGGVSE